MRMQQQGSGPVDDAASYDQFSLERDRYLDKLDFVNWYRYWFLLQAVIRKRPSSVLEIGHGDGIFGAAIASFVARYETVDINPRLNPDHVADVRELAGTHIEPAECVVIADVLEHLPFDDLGSALRNIRHVLTRDGTLLVTIPHRRTSFLYMTPYQIPNVLSVPTGFGSPGAFYRRFIKRRIWIDPDHCWEIGDGHVRRRDVERVFLESGFEIEERRKLVYVDFWTLRVRG